MGSPGAGIGYSTPTTIAAAAAVVSAAQVMRSHRWEGCWPRRSPRTEAATAAEATASPARIQETRSSSAKAWTEPPTPPRVTAPDTRTRIHGRAHSIRIARPCEGWPTACIAATIISQAASIPFSTGSQPQNPPQPSST